MRKLAGLFAVLALLALAGCGYNDLQRQDEQIKAAWSEVLNQYQRRADLVPNLVNTVKGYAAQEEHVLTEVTNARANVGSIKATPELINDPVAFQKFIKAQSELQGALSRLLLVAENYPQLKSDAVFRDLTAQLEGTENRITVARNRYIKAVQEYNVTVRSFPTNLTAMIFKMDVKPNFTVENEAAVKSAAEGRFRQAGAVAAALRRAVRAHTRDAGTDASTEGRRQPRVAPQAAAASPQGDRRESVDLRSNRGAAGNACARAPRGWWLLLAAMLALVSSSVWAQQWQTGTDGLLPIPPLAARVTDLTQTLTPAEVAALEAKLADWEARTSNQLVVLMVPTTQPEPIESYSLRVAEKWKIGRKGQDNGALFLIAKNDRKMRIEVGYGLEGVLTDVTSRRIIAEDVAPAFREGHFAAGINAGVDRIIAVVGEGEPLPPPQADKAKKPLADSISTR